MCFGVGDCRVHGNKMNMIFNTSAQNGRAILFDGHTMGGEAWNNPILCTNNRCVRVRSSFNINIHDNVFTDINGSGVHLGDPDTGTDDLNVTVEHNQFQVDDNSQGIFTRSSVDMFVHDNIFTCGGPLCQGRVAYARQPNTGAITVLTVFNNPSALTFQSPQIWVEPGSTVNVCNTGTAAAGPVGLGTINQIPSCPPPQ